MGFGLLQRMCAAYGRFIQRRWVDLLGATMSHGDNVEGLPFILYDKAASCDICISYEDPWRMAHDHIFRVEDVDGAYARYRRWALCS